MRLSTFCGLHRDTEHELHISYTYTYYAYSVSIQNKSFISSWYIYRCIIHNTHINLCVIYRVYAADLFTHINRNMKNIIQAYFIILHQQINFLKYIIVRCFPFMLYCKSCEHTTDFDQTSKPIHAALLSKATLCGSFSR
jgi:hypothetical protein